MAIDISKYRPVSAGTYKPDGVSKVAGISGDPVFFGGFERGRKRAAYERGISKNNAMAEDLLQQIFGLSQEQYDRDRERWDALKTQLFGENGEGLEDFYSDLQGKEQSSLSEYEKRLDGLGNVSGIFKENPDLFNADVNVGDYIDENAKANRAQASALDRLQALTRPGESAEERLIREQARRRQESDIQSQRRSMADQLQARGMYGSGAEVASALGSIQEAASRRSLEEMQAAALSAQRAREALGQYGQLSSQMRGQDLQTASIRTDADKFKSQLKTQANLAKSQAQLGARATDITNDRDVASALYGAQQNALQNQRTDKSALNDTTFKFGAAESAADQNRTGVLVNSAGKLHDSINQASADMERNMPNSGLLGLGIGDWL